MDFFIRAALDNDFFLHMNTTGFFLNPSRADRLCAAKLSIRFSIHAGTKESYERIMGNNLEVVIQNIGYLVEKNRQKGHGQSEFWFSYIVMKENLDEIEDFLRLAQQAGIMKVRFMALLPVRKIVVGARREEINFDFNFFDQFNGHVTETFLKRLPEINNIARELGISIEVGSMEPSARQKASLKILANQVFRKVVPGKNLFPLIPRAQRTFVWVIFA